MKLDYSSITARSLFSINIHCETTVVSMLIIYPFFTILLPHNSYQTQPLPAGKNGLEIATHITSRTSMINDDSCLVF